MPYQYCYSADNEMQEHTSTLDFAYINKQNTFRGY